MRFSASERIAAPRHAVEAALANPAYYASLATAASNLEAPVLLSATVTDNTLHTSVRYRFAGDISGPAAMALDRDKLTWVIDSTIDLTHHEGQLTVIPDHYDGLLRCQASIAFADETGQTVETIAGNLDVSIPLIGATAEKVILAGFTQHLEREAVALAAFCSAEI
ncbi:MAG: DUF2505 family protein [Actinomycetes bacterium]